MSLGAPSFRVVAKGTWWHLVGGGWLSTRWSCTPRFDAAGVALGQPWSLASFPYPGKEGPWLSPALQVLHT